MEPYNAEYGAYTSNCHYCIVVAGKAYGHYHDYYLAESAALRRGGIVIRHKDVEKYGYERAEET